jgi:hypothetical protein
MNNNKSYHGLFKDPAEIFEFIIKSTFFGPIIQYFLFYIFIYPFYCFYLYGPTFLGCWEGQKFATICSIMNGPNGGDENFWNLEQNEEICKAKILKNFISHYSVLILLVYIYVLYKLFNILSAFIHSFLKKKKHQNTFINKSSSSKEEKKFKHKFQIKQKKSSSPEINLKKSNSKSKNE